MDLRLTKGATTRAFNRSSLLSFSFVSIVLINTLFFSGYYILKDPLAYILHSEGIPLKQAYSITTTANTLLALSSLFFAFTLHNCSKQKLSLLVGITLSVFSIFLLRIKNPIFSMIGISSYVIGGGLYFFNIVMFINRLFADNQTRIRGNYIYQIFVNLGGAVGCILFITQINKLDVFKACFISGTISLALFILLYRFIDNGHNEKVDLKKFYFYLTVLFGIVFCALNFAQMTRYVVFVSFILAAGYVAFNAYIQQNKNLLLFIALVFLFNIPYWIANTVIFNEFFYFLTHDVSSVYGLSPILIITLDPLANILFGLSMFNGQKNSQINHYKNLSYSSFFLLAAFVVLAIGLFFSQNKISYIYPVLMMILFACSEFLLQTTLNSKIKDLLANYKKGEFLATGIMRSSRSFATVLGYCLITLTTKDNGVSIKNDIHVNFELYLIMILICVMSQIGFRFLRKSQIIFLKSEIN